MKHDECGVMFQNGVCCCGCGRTMETEPMSTAPVEVERLLRVERYAREVMDALEQHGAGIVGHLLDNDENSGERLRRALRGDHA